MYQLHYHHDVRDVRGVALFYFFLPYQNVQQFIPIIEKLVLFYLFTVESKIENAKTRKIIFIILNFLIYIYVSLI